MPQGLERPHHCASARPPANARSTRQGVKCFERDLDHVPRKSSSGRYRAFGLLLPVDAFAPFLLCHDGSAFLRDRARRVATKAERRHPARPEAGSWPAVPDQTCLAIGSRIFQLDYSGGSQSEAYPKGRLAMFAGRAINGAVPGCTRHWPDIGAAAVHPLGTGLAAPTPVPARRL